MLKKLFWILLALLASSASVAGVELNRADQGQLESVKGIGPVTARNILEERRKGDFKDWQDFTARVKGVGPGKAGLFSQEGLRINGTAWPRIPVSPSPATAPSLTAELPGRR